MYMYETNPNSRLEILVDNAKLSSDLAAKSLPKVKHLFISFGSATLRNFQFLVF